LRDVGGEASSGSSGAAHHGPAAGANAAAGSTAAAGPSAAGGPDFELISEGEVFGGDRETVRRASVRRALELVLQFGKPA
jgi:hypothetical protein